MGKQCQIGTKYEAYKVFTFSTPIRVALRIFQVVMIGLSESKRAYVPPCIHNMYSMWAPPSTRTDSHPVIPVRLCGTVCLHYDIWIIILFHGSCSRQDSTWKFITFMLLHVSCVFSSPLLHSRAYQKIIFDLSTVEKSICLTKIEMF